MIGPLVHVIGVASHAGVPARANWFPWTDDEWQYVGWRVEPFDGGDSILVYLVPDLESEDRCVDIVVGTTGDPDQDTHVERITF